MKTTRTIVICALSIAAVLMCYFCVTSVTTPIKFENTRAEREVTVIKHLVDLRTAEVEYHHQKGVFTASYDTLLMFLKKNQFEDNDALYAYIWENDKDVISNGLAGFRRDTIELNMLQSLYKGEYDENSIDAIVEIPFSEGKKFELEVNNEYKTSQGIHVPLFEARAPFESYLGDLNKQELVNLVDREQKLEHYPGLKVGDIYSPNNNAGNWE